MKRSAWLLAFAFVVGCAGPDAPDPNLMVCGVDRSVDVLDADATIPGFALTPAQALARLAAPAVGSLGRAAGGGVPLTLTLTPIGGMRFEERSWQGGAGIEPLLLGDCDDVLAQSVQVRLIAAPDVDVDAVTTARIDAAGTVRFALSVAEGWAPSAAPATEEGDAVALLLSGERGEGAWRGEVGFALTRVHGDGNDGTVSVSFVEHGTFAAAAP